MFRLGLTGSIATGKSTVLDAFKAEGVPVYSADAAVAELYSGEAVPLVEALFPGVAVGGHIDRQRLSERLRADPSGFPALEAVVHPLVRERIGDFLASAEEAGYPLAVVEVPLLFESGHDYGFDAVAVTHVDEAEQRRRAMARPAMSGEKLDTILARQLPQAEKRSRADYLIDTGTTLAETRRQVAELVESIRRRQGQV